MSTVQSDYRGTSEGFKGISGIAQGSIVNLPANQKLLNIEVNRLPFAIPLLPQGATTAFYPLPSVIWRCSTTQNVPDLAPRLVPWDQVVYDSGDIIQETVAVAAGMNTLPPVSDTAFFMVFVSLYSADAVNVVVTGLQSYVPRTQIYPGQVGFRTLAYGGYAAGGSNINVQYNAGPASSDVYAGAEFTLIRMG